MSFQYSSSAPQAQLYEYYQHCLVQHHLTRHNLDLSWHDCWSSHHQPDWPTDWGVRLRRGKLMSGSNPIWSFIQVPYCMQNIISTATVWSCEPGSRTKVNTSDDNGLSWVNSVPWPWFDLWKIDLDNWDSRILIYALRTHIHIQWGVKVSVLLDMNHMDWAWAQIQFTPYSGRETRPIVKMGLNLGTIPFFFWVCVFQVFRDLFLLLSSRSCSTITLIMSYLPVKEVLIFLSISKSCY